MLSSGCLLSSTSTANPRTAFSPLNCQTRNPSFSSSSLSFSHRTFNPLCLRYILTSTLLFPFIFFLIFFPSFDFRSFTRHHGIRIPDNRGITGFRVRSYAAPYPLTTPNVQWISTVSALSVFSSLSAFYFLFAIMQ